MVAFNLAVYLLKVRYNSFSLNLFVMQFQKLEFPIIYSLENLFQHWNVDWKIGAAILLNK